MSFPRDAYPYTNFHELNLGYFIVHFREIFSQWADLYDQMLNWKDATDEELATWKAGVEADLDQREAALRAELETWKAQTGQDIAGWEDATLAALTAWQTATQAVFEAIRVEAAGSASAAAASAGDAATAKTAAETAQAAAEAAAASVQASAAQITTNTEDIADLKTQITHITPDMTTFVAGGEIDPDGNLIYPDDLIDHYWINTVNGSYDATTYNYCVTPYVEIIPDTDYTFAFIVGSQNGPYSWAFYDDSKTVLTFGRTIGGVTHVTSPSNAKYLAYCFSGLKESNPYPIMMKGDTAITEYIAPTKIPLTIPESDYTTKEYVDNTFVKKGAKLELPDKYECVVGDTMQLFWKGVINTADNSIYYPDVTCDIGKSFTRYFEYTGATADIGTHTMKVDLYDSEGNLLDSQNVNLVVKAKATSPASEKVVLYVTDSLGNSGYAPDEFNRRLVGTGGTPAGDGLTNITFIGDKESLNRQIKYVGNGGWTWASYNSAMSTNAYMWITSAAHDKTIDDQHSIYKDSNNTEWKLETHYRQ